MDQRTDRDLLCDIQSRFDKSALAALYDRFGRKIYALAYGILRSASDAEDVMQEVFETVWKKASSYQSELGEPKYWLLRIAHNRSINALKARALRRPDATNPASGGSPESTAREEYAQEPEDNLDFDITELVGNALAGLPDDQRHLIELAFFKGYSHSEIAENERIPLGTVKTRIRSGILKLRSELEFLRN